MQSEGAHSTHAAVVLVKLFLFRPYMEAPEPAATCMHAHGIIKIHKDAMITYKLWFLVMTTVAQEYIGNWPQNRQHLNLAYPTI